MAVIRLYLEGEQKIQVKPNPVEFIYTGSTQYNFIGSGATTVDVVNKNVTIFTPIGGVTIAGSGITTVSNVGDAYVIYTPPTDLSDYWTTGQTQSAIDAATSGITSSWNDIEDKPSWLSGTTIESFQLAHTHSYTGLTDLPTLFSGNYNDLSNKPTLFDGDYNSLNNKPDLSVYLTGVTWNIISDKPDLWTTGETVSYVTGLGYITGVTWNQVTDKPDLTLQSDFTGHTSQVGSGSIHFTGHTFTASGGTVIDVTGDVVTIYSPTGGTSGGDLVIEVITGTSYTLSDADKDKVLEFTATGDTVVNLPSGLTAGFQCNIVNIGGQEITLTKTGGGNLRTIGNYVRVKNKYGGVWIYLRSTNEYLAQGDLS